MSDISLKASFLLHLVNKNKAINDEPVSNKVVNSDDCSFILKLAYFTLIKSDDLVYLFYTDKKFSTELKKLNQLNDCLNAVVGFDCDTINNIIIDFVIGSSGYLLESIDMCDDEVDRYSDTDEDGNFLGQLSESFIIVNYDRCARYLVCEMGSILNFIKNTTVINRNNHPDLSDCFDVMNIAKQIIRLN